MTVITPSLRRGVFAEGSAFWGYLCRPVRHLTHPVRRRTGA
ncbi:MAG TPA: hypothetical protein VMA73_23375 [Streptosporangiaceae bacterium]|nr:hypothetical protein [Streptosporangiaceae bacterium]